jgi:hypothetical protein
MLQAKVKILLTIRASRDVPAAVFSSKLKKCDVHVVNIPLE